MLRVHGARRRASWCSTAPRRARAAVRIPYHFYFHHVLPVIGRLVSGHRTAYQYLPGSVDNFPDGDCDSRGACASAGIAQRDMGAAHLRHLRASLRRARRHEHRHDLATFIAQIDAIGELVRITQPVRAELEICEIADRVMKSADGGPALLFEHVILRDGSRSAYPGRDQSLRLDAAHGALARRRRISMTSARASRRCVQMKVPEGLMGKLSMLPRAARDREISAAREERSARRVRRSCGRATTSISRSCRSSRAGRRTAARTSRCRW